MITSKTNELIKHIKALHTKKERDERKEFIVEGKKMVKEAIDANLEITNIIICEELLKENFEAKQDKVEYVSKIVFEYISDTQTPQGILAIVKKPEYPKEYGEKIFALDNVQDPGNVGTIIRTLDSAGINTLLLSENCADEYNMKVIRSTMGAIFRVKIYRGSNLKETLINLKTKGYKIIVTDLNTKANLFEYEFPKKAIVVIGNESNGVSEEIKNIADERVKIPMVGGTESLNAGVAASLMAYEILRKNNHID